MTENPSTILIVDDLQDMREVLTDMLYGNGYHVLEADSGANALRMAEVHLPDLVLLDIMMPEMDGFEVCRRLRAHPTLNTVPIIMVTALDDRQTRLRGIEAGADDFVGKPFDRTELRARIRTVTRLNRYQRLLREQEQRVAEQARFAWVVEHTDDGYLILDQHTHIRYANHQSRRYLSLDDVLPGDRTFREVCAEHYHFVPADEWHVWPTSGGVLTRYLVMPEHPNARAFWLQVETHASSQATWIVRLRDVTAKMTSHRSVWTFHAMISHKLRTPLVGLIGGLRIAAGRSKTISSSELEELLTVATQGAERLSTTITEILKYLDMTERAVGGQLLHVAHVMPVIHDISNEFPPARVVALIDPTLSTEVLTLPQREFELILRELIDNACKFHPTNEPTIQVSITPRPGNRICLSVTDDGITLSPEHLQQVWEPYYQAERDFTGQLKGMGLGLPTVAHIVWSIGGDCHIANRTDERGIIVELLVPIEDCSPGTVQQQ